MKSEKRKFVTLSIGDVAARTGMKVSAIRYYEEIGLIQAIRSEGANRRFTRSEIRKVSFIAISQTLGFSLKEISTDCKNCPMIARPIRQIGPRSAERFANRLINESL